MTARPNKSAIEISTLVLTVLLNVLVLIGGFFGAKMYNTGQETHDMALQHTEQLKGIVEKEATQQQQLDRHDKQIFDLLTEKR